MLTFGNYDLLPNRAVLDIVPALENKIADIALQSGYSNDPYLVSSWQLSHLPTLLFFMGLEFHLFGFES